MTQHTVRVGLLTAPKVEIILSGLYRCGDATLTGELIVEAQSLIGEMSLQPCGEDCSVEIKDVIIGINFHWERKVNQRFKGEISILPVEGQLTIINILPIETYLKSVISSEMSATSSLEFLKAHSVISRSWLMAQIEGKKGQFSAEGQCEETERVIRWYGHTDHELFDVCADDHCQRYQGITRQTSAKACQAVDETSGEVLMSGDELCDARFSKCCGGVMEVFESCWEDQPKSYLIPRRDFTDPSDFPDLTLESEARKWIEGSPQAFCNTSDSEILGQVLVDFDQETTDFYRWSVEYKAQEISDLICRKSGIDFGLILDLIPIRRGPSGRIVELKIIGEKRTVIVGKELEIRRWLSESHLYSSAFVVDKTPEGFRLRGAGWGHGVGLCQIGAAVMAAKGYIYRQILEHYYPGTRICKI